MGTWNASITGNDTAQDLYAEYCAAFYKYDVDEALTRIDHYIRTEMFDESDEEEWCNFFYSLADFMWKKGILTDSVRDQALSMIDSDFGLELWAEEGPKMLASRKKKLAEFREKLLSPQPPKKKIKPNAHTERIFEDGDVIAVQLQTAGKPYTHAKYRPMSEEAFHALDGKYVLMQLVECFSGWTSDIVPEVKDYWAHFRLFDGIYDTVPDSIDVSKLKDAMFPLRSPISSAFTCASSLFYFKRRNYKIICNRKDLLANYKETGYYSIDWGCQRPWQNPDSELVSAIGMQVTCSAYTGTPEELQYICRYANLYGRYDYRLSKEENEAKFAAEEALIEANIRAALENGGKLYSVTFGKVVGIVTVTQGHIHNLYIEGQFQSNGFGTRLLEYAFSVAGNGAYIEVPTNHKVLLHICNKLGLIKSSETGHTVLMVKP